MELGLIVYSKAGRDQGAYYAVVEIVDENTVKIADGDLRHIKKRETQKRKTFAIDGRRARKDCGKTEKRHASV